MRLKTSRDIGKVREGWFLYEVLVAYAEFGVMQTIFWVVKTDDADWCLDESVASSSLLG